MEKIHWSNGKLSVCYVTILYGLLGRDQKYIITAYNFMNVARFSPPIKLFVLDLMRNLIAS